MQEDITPKVFISYSWSSDELVVPLAQRLMAHGMNVVLDKWDLKEGQDKYAFMEQCVNDPDITKVLIICDKAYATKANARTGGVGDETVIISGEIYGKMKQEKFIPVIAERDEDGAPFVPTYIKTRIYIDLSNEETYEVEYDKLLRNIYDKPLYSKPQLGQRPDWIDEERTNLFPLTDLIRQIKGATTAKKQRSCINKFIDEYIIILKTYYIQGVKNGKEVFDHYVETKPVRDVFLDFIPVLAETDLSFSEMMCGAFERMYNSLTNGRGFGLSTFSVNSNDYEIYKILIWELFICTIAYLRHVEDYQEINGLITNTYFLSLSWQGENTTARNYCEFVHYSSIIEEQYKPTTKYKNKLTLLGNTLYEEREKLPIFSGKAIAEADLFLYQVKNAFEIVEDKNRWHDSYWFPTCYVYCEKGAMEWTKMRSRKFCQRLFPLFGVSTLDELKAAVAKCTDEKGKRYSDAFDIAPTILDCIRLDEIGSVN